jgi:hypothetical protein
MPVSVIVPCFNHATTLERAVGSALRQTGIREVIIVDDASTDQSATVAQNLLAHDAKIQLFGQEANRGPGAARNRGVAQASGEFICFLDADDELIGDFVGTALSLFEQSPELIVAKCEMEFFDPVKGYILPVEDPRHQAAILSSSCGMLMRREHFLRMGGFPQDEVFRGPAGGEDVAFMQAVMAHFQPIARIEQPGYRVWSQSGSHLDRFLSNTRLNESSFEFVDKHVNVTQNQAISDGIAAYLDTISCQLIN